MIARLSMRTRRLPRCGNVGDVDVSALAARQIDLTRLLLPLRSSQSERADYDEVIDHLVKHLPQVGRR
jgi:hypothetical protein